jgi:hypothetical protein
VVGDSYQLFARIGVREEAHSTHALSGESAERGADTAAVRITKKRSRIGRSGEADIDRHIGRSMSKIGTIFDDADRCERELRDNEGAEADWLTSRAFR